jgi:acetyl esterase
MDAEHPYAVPRAPAPGRPAARAGAGTGPGRPDARRSLAYAERLRAAGVAVTTAVLGPATGWPGSLEQAPPDHCPCAAEARRVLQAFFQAPTPPPG